MTDRHIEAIARAIEGYLDPYPAVDTRHMSAEDARDAYLRSVVAHEPCDGTGVLGAVEIVDPHTGDHLGNELVECDAPHQIFDTPGGKLYADPDFVYDDDELHFESVAVVPLPSSWTVEEPE